MKREINVEVFQDTIKLCETNKTLVDSIAESIKGQKLILECEEKEVQIKNRYDNDAKVIVSRKRTFEASMNYPDDKVCVLNFASASTPGGGVVKEYIKEFKIIEFAIYCTPRDQSNYTEFSNVMSKINK